MCKLNKYEKGFSLIEVMLSSALIIIVSFGITTLFLSNNRYSRSIARQQQLSEVQKYIFSILNNKKLCEDTFVTPAVAVPSTLPDTFDHFMGAGSFFGEVKPGGHPFPGLRIENIEMLDSSSLPVVDERISTIRLTVKDEVGSVGAAPQSMDFLFHYSVTGSTITSCHASANKQDIQKANCLAAGLTYRNLDFVIGPGSFDQKENACTPCLLLGGTLVDDGSAGDPIGNNYYYCKF